MLYEIRDNWAERSYMVRGADIRAKLNDMMPQCDEKTAESIDFIADYYEGKHSFRLLTIERENTLDIAIFNTGERC